MRAWPLFRSGPHSPSLPFLVLTVSLEEQGRTFLPCEVQPSIFPSWRFTSPAWGRFFYQLSGLAFWGKVGWGQDK